VTEQEIRAYLIDNTVPVGWRYSIVMASITKRMLGFDMPDDIRLQFLDHLDKMTSGGDGRWFTAEMMAKIEPMDDRGYAIYREAQKLGPKKALDVLAEMFPAFAMLNNSLIAALNEQPHRRPLATSFQ
jgi:hypothetical protein